MPKPIHELLIESAVNEIKHHLKSISEGVGPSADFAEEVACEGSTTIEFDEREYGHHDPDSQFRHTNAKYPGVILEVANSQKARLLPHLADDYILGSNGNIRAVICINLEYKQRGQASLSVWEPRIVPNDIGEPELAAIQVVIDQVLFYILPYVLS
jgi:hypothetical protein